MRAVLGIDAAWTEKEPSGVGLIADDGSGWRLVDVAASYATFVGDVGTSGPIARHRGSIPDAQAILTAAKMMIGVHVDLVAIDMPLSTIPIVGRRVSDNMISVAYGARHASTHTPSVTRPGRLSDILRNEFDAVGYPLAVKGFVGPAVIEVYPHPARIELAAADQRLPYKHSKIAKYWRQEPPAVRRQMLVGVWTRIIDLLDLQIQGVRAGLPLPASDAKGYQMKAFEDQLDAIICAWVGACAMDGKAEAYGDGESAIWVPHPAVRQIKLESLD